MNAPLLVMTRQDPWEGFSEGAWRTEVNVRDFINQNYTPYVGDDSFLAGATEVYGAQAIADMYGDILPVSRLARSLATLEALIGQLYPAIIIARLVSMPRA